jgi:hypothetical protein
MIWLDRHPAAHLATDRGIASPWRSRFGRDKLSCTMRAAIGLSENYAASCATWVLVGCSECVINH